MSTLQVDSLQQLQQLLSQAGIDTSQWDGQQYKSLEELFEELNHGDSRLCWDETHGLVRHVNLVAVMLHYRNLLLVEKQQNRQSDGKTRSRKLVGSLIEKLMSGESPKDGATRLLSEEMEIETSLAASSFREGHHQLSSPSYPGLQSSYHIHLAQCEMPEQLYRNQYQVEYEGWTTTWEWVGQGQSEHYFQEL